MDVVKDSICLLICLLNCIVWFTPSSFSRYPLFPLFSHQGDNVDRGAGTIDVYKLLQKLRGQASAAGGAVSISFWCQFAFALAALIDGVL